MTKEEFRDFEMEEIAEAIHKGSFSGITDFGSTWYVEMDGSSWHIHVNFEYGDMEDEDDGV